MQVDSDHHNLPMGTGSPSDIAQNCQHGNQRKYDIASSPSAVVNPEWEKLEQQVRAPYPVKPKGVSLAQRRHNRSATGASQDA